MLNAFGTFRETFVEVLSSGAAGLDTLFRKVWAAEAELRKVRSLRIR